MIASHLHNFIFIKTRKTAGSSMETALAGLCGPDDIVTPFGPREEIKRYKTDPNAYPRNFCSDKEGEKRYLQALASGKRKVITATLKELLEKATFQRHGGVRSARDAVDRKLWKKAYKFSIERHPYEKAVSLAWFAKGSREFSVALDEVLKGDGYRNFRLYAPGGKPAVDFIIRYEHLAEDIGKVEQALGGLQILSRLPRVNASTRKDKTPAREILNDEQKKIIRKLCRKEFALFDYEP